MRINHNLSSINSYNQLTANNQSASKSMEKLSTGQRINRAADDAAGLNISEKMRNQVRGLEQAQRNSQDGISLIQTAEGGLNETHDILSRMRELAVQAGNSINKTDEMAAIQEEVNQLLKEIDGTAGRTEFNGANLLSGAHTFQLQIGANKTQNLSFTIEDMSTTGLTLAALSTAFTVGGSGFSADLALTTIDSAIQAVSKQRSNIGAIQNRLEHTINNLGTQSENLTAAESRIRDVDMAKEMMQFSKNNILSQAAQSMLAQANQQPQSVLQLLR